MKLNNLRVYALRRNTRAGEEHVGWSFLGCWLQNFVLQLARFEGNCNMLLAVEIQNKN